MARKPNRNPPTHPATRLDFKPHELRFLRLNTPGPSGVMGGYQQFENWIVTTVDQATGSLVFDPVRLERLIRYCKPRDGYGPGGPNQRLRNACIPALRRAGIELVPGWGSR